MRYMHLYKPVFNCISIYRVIENLEIGSTSGNRFHIVKYVSKRHLHEKNDKKSEGKEHYS